MSKTPDLTEAIIQSFQDVTPTVREFTLKPSQGGRYFDPGSHLQVQVLVHGLMQRLRHK